MRKTGLIAILYGALGMAAISMSISGCSRSVLSGISSEERISSNSKKKIFSKEQTKEPWLSHKEQMNEKQMNVLQTNFARYCSETELLELKRDEYKGVLMEYIKKSIFSDSELNKYIKAKVELDSVIVYRKKLQSRMGRILWEYLKANSSDKDK